MKNKRNWFFFALRLFPLVAFVLAVHQTGVQDLGAHLDAFMPYFRWDFIADILNNCLGTMGVAVPTFASSYASWLVLVLFVQILYDVIAFLPDVARWLFEKGVRSAE